MFKRLMKKSESHAEVTHASIRWVDLTEINIIKLALDQLKHAFAIGEGVLRSDKLQLTRTYIEAMEKLQHEKEAGTHQPQSRLSADNLLLKEGATHKADTDSQPQLVPSWENQKWPGSCPPSTQVSRGISYPPVWDSAYFTPPPSSTPQGKRENEMTPPFNFPSQDEPDTQLYHTYGFGEVMPHNHAAGYQHEFLSKWTPGNTFIGQLELPVYSPQVATEQFYHQQGGTRKCYALL